MFQTGLPSCFTTDQPFSASAFAETDGVKTVFVFNFGEKAAEKSLTLPEKSHVYAVWYDRYDGETDVIRAVLPPHASEIFFIGDDKSVMTKIKKSKRL